MSCQNIIKCTQSRFALCDLTRICAHHDGSHQAFLHICLEVRFGSTSKLIQIFLPDMCAQVLSFVKKMVHMTFATVIAYYFTLIFFRFNMFIWRSIMSYVNAVLIKISVLNSTMTTASTSKFHLPFHFIYLRSRPDIFEHQMQSNASFTKSSRFKVANCIAINFNQFHH